MAAPVGHVVSALLLLNSSVADIPDRNAFLAGANFPDIRYITDINRSTTHKTNGRELRDVFSAASSFERGRRFHVFVDEKREKHMRERNAYKFIAHGPLKTQMLKIVEDNVMFDKLKGFQADEVFGRIYDEERAYSIADADITTWHKLLQTYLSQSYWFNFVRYYKTLVEFQKAYGTPKGFIANFWQNVRTLGFFIYAYFQVEKLSQDPELRSIIFDFYENKLQEFIFKYRMEQGSTVEIELEKIFKVKKIIDFS